MGGKTQGEFLMKLIEILGRLKTSVV